MCYCARRGASGALLPTIRYSRAECCRRLSAWEAGLCKERWYQGLVQRDTVNRVRVGTQQHYADWACATRLLWSSHLQRYRFGVDCQLHRTVFRPLRTAKAVRFLSLCRFLPANCTTCGICFAFRFRTENNVQLVNNFFAHSVLVCFFDNSKCNVKKWNLQNDRTAPHVVDLTLATQKNISQIAVACVWNISKSAALLTVAIQGSLGSWRFQTDTHINCKLLKKRRFTSKGCRGSCKQKSNITRKNGRHLSAVQKMHR